MLYHAYEINHAAISPMRQVAKVTAAALRNPFNPLSSSLPARTSAAVVDMFLSATRRYGKPEFGIESVEIEGREMAVVEEKVVEKPFCDLIHFRRRGAADRNDPAVLIVAPMSGHFATLLRGTVEAMLPGHEVYVTDWVDARNVPLSDGKFGMDEYIDYIDGFCGVLHALHGERAAVMAVCQPGVPVLAAAALMAEDGDAHRPASIVLMGSPIDTTRNPTEPDVLATTRPLSWFEKNLIVTVPWPNMGFLRRVYPGFLQLSGFMSMNLDRHVDAHVQQFQHLVEGDGESVESHNAFYDEFLAVMDMTAEFYLETIEVVFQKHALPRGQMTYRGDRKVRTDKITDIALMTVEGEKDDITGRGQTAAAHALCPNLPGAMKFHWVQHKVGHFGVFNGSRFRSSIQPKIAGFFAEHRGGGTAEFVEIPPRADKNEAKASVPVVAASERASAAEPATLSEKPAPKAAEPASKPAKSAPKPARKAPTPRGARKTKGAAACGAS